MRNLLKALLNNREDRLIIIKNTEKQNSYENRIADFDKKYGILLKESFLKPDFYFSSREYYAAKVYGKDIILTE